MLGLQLVVAVLIAVVAVVASRYFVSPAQQAADAAPPSPSMITAPVTFGKLAATLTLRAQVADVNPVQVRLPDDLGSALPVVTSVSTKADAKVSDGELLLTVAERPVFVMTGEIPAFRDMAPGTSGVDVAELQAGLAAAGYSSGGDTLGDYGPGTQAAVYAFYQAAGVQPALTSSDAEKQLQHLATAVDEAQSALGKADAKLATDTDAKKSGLLAGDRAAVQTAQQALTSAQQALADGQQTMGATVPRGEVVFVPHLPATLVGLSVSPGATASGTLARIGSGKVALSGDLSSAPPPQLKVGMTATATSDISGTSFPVKVTSIAASADSSGGYPVTFAPVGSVPAGVVGQNVAVSITTASSSTQVFIVPIAAISTAGSGATYVTVVGRNGQERTVWVTLGVSASGQQGVTPASGSTLRAGDQVLIGITAAGG